MAKKSNTFIEHCKTLTTDEKKDLFAYLHKECRISINSFYRYAAGTLNPSPPAAILIAQKMLRDPDLLFPNINK